MPITIQYFNDDINQYDSFKKITQISNFDLVFKIDCSKNELTILPDNMNFPNLELLYCSNNKLISLPNMNCPNLHWLDCSFNQLKFIPDTMNFSNLEYFDCRNNQLISLPDINFRNLLRVECSKNKLRSLPNMNCPNLYYFKCSDNKLTSLPNMNFPNLQTFDCNSNQLTSLLNMNLPNLQTLDCYNNKLTSLPDNMNLANLLQFNCQNNQLTSLPDYMNFPNLEEFYCCNNKLTSLPNNMNFPNLRRFDCSKNELTILPDNMNFQNLNILYFYDNQLTLLPDNMNFPNLREFYCSNNQLTSLPVCILNFRNLQSFSYHNNEIELSLQIARFIHRIDTSFNKKKLNVYNDTQNAHNSTIQLCVRDSINRITTRTDLKKYNIDQLHTLILWLKTNNLITEISTQLLFEYIADTTLHSLLLLTFSEVLWFIIQTIITDFTDIIQVEIFKILNQEIKDADCKCFTGRMNRIINCLNGFSPLVSININDGEQIGNIIILVKNKLELTGVYTVEKHKIEVEKELLERNYDVETIKTWLEYID